MDKYYYLIAQLPLLSFDKETYFTIDNFFEEAKKWASKKDFELLSRVSLFDTTRDSRMPKYIREYQHREYQLRIELAQWRQSLKEGQELKLEQLPPSVVKEGDPLQVEKKLLAFRWNVIDTLEQEHHFDLAFLVYYLLKLQILEHLLKFEKEKGLEIFQNIVNETNINPEDKVII